MSDRDGRRARLDRRSSGASWTSYARRAARPTARWSATASAASCLVELLAERRGLDDRPRGRALRGVPPRHRPLRLGLERRRLHRRGRRVRAGAVHRGRRVAPSARGSSPTPAPTTTRFATSRAGTEVELLRLADRIEVSGGPIRSGLSRRRGRRDLRGRCPATGSTRRRRAPRPRAAQPPAHPAADLHDSRAGSTCGRRTRARRCRTPGRSPTGCGLGVERVLTARPSDAQ